MGIRYARAAYHLDYSLIAFGMEKVFEIFRKSTSCVSAILIISKIDGLTPIIFKHFYFRTIDNIKLARLHTGGSLPSCGFPCVFPDYF